MKISVGWHEWNFLIKFIVSSRIYILYLNNLKILRFVLICPLFVISLIILMIMLSLSIRNQELYTLFGIIKFILTKLFLAMLFFYLYL